MSPTANDVAMGLSLGGPAGTRTQDTRIKSPVLYQLSYGPVPMHFAAHCLAAPAGGLLRTSAARLSRVDYAKARL